MNLPFCRQDLHLNSPDLFSYIFLNFAWENFATSQYFLRQIGNKLRLSIPLKSFFRVHKILLHADLASSTVHLSFLSDKNSKTSKNFKTLHAIRLLKIIFSHSPMKNRTQQYF